MTDLNRDSDEWQLAGTVGVDSASIAIHDPAFWSSLEGTRLPDHEPYVGPAGIMGVVLLAGNGDGSYPVEVRFGPSEFGDRRVAEVRVRLLNPDGSSVECYR